MKTTTNYSTLLFSFFVLLFGASACNRSDNMLSANDEYGYLNVAAWQSQINSLPLEPLSEAERLSISHMREEEKLARDVYAALSARWGTTIFSHINGAEQTHMDAVAALLTKYTLADPISGYAAGQFRDTVFQTLYNSLVQQGTRSIVDAMIVGETIEDLDINDLNNIMTVADNQDVRLVYDNLRRGSRNHMRAFYYQLTSNGGNYAAQFISASEFKSIVNSSMESGFCCH